MTEAMDEKQIGNGVVRLMLDDITLLDVDAFVFYAQHDLALGSGFGTAISIRGGPAIQKELETLGPLETTQAVVSEAGNLKSKFIVHSVGPRFQEEDIEGKLRATVLNAYKAAEEKGVERIAFPAMGVGFYGIPVEVSARVTLEAIKEYMQGATRIRETVVCLLDKREYQPFQKHLAAMG